jgi:hypothetical protein
VVVRVVGFDPRCGPAQPDPAQLGPRAAGARALPMCPPSPGLFPSFNSPAQQPPLSLPPLSLPPPPRGALDFGDADRRNLDPQGELPSPLSLSLSLPPLHSFPRARSLRVPAALRARAQAASCPVPLAGGGSPRRPCAPVP